MLGVAGIPRPGRAIPAPTAGPAPRHHHGLPGPGGAGEHHRVQPSLWRDADPAAARGVGHQAIGPGTHPQAPVPLAGRLRAARQRPFKQPLRRARLAAGRAGRHIALAQPQALAVVEPAQFFAPVAGDVAIRADGQRHAGIQPAAQITQAIAQVGLGAGADHHARTAAGHGVDLGRHRVGGMHQLPARVQQALAGQPFDRALAGACQAVVHLGRLLGRMDVDRALKARSQVTQLVDGLGRRRAQRVDHQAGVQRGRAGGGCGPSGGWDGGVGRVGGVGACPGYPGCLRGRPLGDALRGRPHAGRAGGKAPLVVVQRGLGKAGALVQRGHQRQADAHLLRCVGQCPGHGLGIGIGLAAGLVVQVVKLANLGVAAPQQLQIKLGCNGLHLGRADAQRHPVHALAPRPEIIGSRLAPLSHAGKCALERMAVRIDQAGQQRAGQHRRSRRRLGRVGRDFSPVAVRADAQQHLGLPAAGQPGLRRPQQVARGVGSLGAAGRLRHRAAMPGRFAAARAAPVAAAPPARATAPTGVFRACSKTSTSPSARRGCRLAAGRIGG